MSESPLSTFAGPIAVVAGGLLAVTHVGMVLVEDPKGMVESMRDPLFQAFNAGYAVAFPLLMLALVGLYWRQAREAGRFGAIAFSIAAAGTVLLGGDMYFEGFAAPWLAQVAPQLFSLPRGPLLAAAWLVSVVLFSLGWALFGLASWRARILPRALSAALAVGGLIGFQAAMPPWGVALGLAVAATGIWWIRQDQTVPPVQGLGESLTVSEPRYPDREGSGSTRSQRA
jgi:hypothetical protein